MDIVILLLFVSQLAAFVTIGVAVLRIKNGPVKAAGSRIAPLITHGKGIAASGQVQFAHKKDRVLRFVDEIKAMIASVRAHSTAPDNATMPINYKNIGTAFAVLRTARSASKQISRFRPVREGAVAPPGPAKVQRQRKAVSFAERLGLVPPAAKHLGKVVKVAKYGLEVRKQLKKQGIVK